MSRPRIATLSFDSLRAIKERHHLISKVDIEYDGMGDSGSVEHITTDLGTLSDTEEEDLKNFVYEALANHHAGWEINEGSAGTFVIDFKKETVVWNHGYREMEIHYRKVKGDFGG